MRDKRGQTFSVEEALLWIIDLFLASLKLKCLDGFYFFTNSFSLQM